MYVNDCISLTLKVISFLTEYKGDDLLSWNPVYNKNNFNICSFGIDKDGLFIIEQSQFGGFLGCGNQNNNRDSLKTYIPYTCLIKMMFDHQPIPSLFFDQLENSMDFYPYKMFSIEKIVRRLGLTEEMLSNYLGSYIDIVECIEDIRISYFMEQTNDFAYYKLLNILKDVNPSSSGLLSEIKSIARLSYKDIANINIVNPPLARKLEQMYLIENHLIQCCKKEVFVAQQVGGKLVYNKSPEEITKLISQIDLSNCSTAWREYFNIISIHTKPFNLKNNLDERSILGLDSSSNFSNQQKRKIYGANSNS